MKKILSIIIPTYNMEQYLRNCLTSLFIPENLMDAVEILIVNDGSTDSTRAIAESFASAYPRTFRVINKSNGHYGSCINAGLREAKGKYCKVLDADDWFETRNYADFVRYLLSTGTREAGPDVIFSDFDFVHTDGWIMSTYSYRAVQSPGFKMFHLISLEGANQVWMHALTYKTENVRRLGYCQSTGIAYTDFEWVVEPMASVKTVGYFPGVVYKYRNGQPGQSCGGMAYVKNYWMQYLIVQHVVEFYNKVRAKLTPELDAYFRTSIERRVRDAYYRSLYEGHGLGPKYLDDAKLAAFDAFLRDNARWAYDVVSGFRLSNRVKYYYVKAWRKHGRMGMGMRMFINAYRHLRSIKRNKIFPIKCKILKLFGR